MIKQALLAQWIARWTSNPKVVGSSPTQGTFLNLESKSVSFKKPRTVRVVLVVRNYGPYELLQSNDSLN